MKKRQFDVLVAYRMSQDEKRLLGKLAAGEESCSAVVRRLIHSEADRRGFTQKERP